MHLPSMKLGFGPISCWGSFFAQAESSYLPGLQPGGFVTYWTCCDYADTLRERDGDGDKENAAALLDESLAISSELGMRPLMERVLSRREILGA